MDIDTPAIRRLRDRIFAVESQRTPSQGGVDVAPAQEAALERVSPLVEVMVLMMAADGETDSRERRTVRDAVGVLTSGVISPAALDALLVQLDRARSTQGIEARLEAIGTQLALRKADAEAAFSLAAAVGVSDDEVAAAEQSMLVQLRRYLGISEARARALLDGAPPTPAR